MLPHQQIEKRLAAGGPHRSFRTRDVSVVLIRPPSDAKFGDYQSNAALMSLAKIRKLNPRQLATDVVAKLDVSEWCDKVASCRARGF